MLYWERRPNCRTSRRRSRYLEPNSSHRVWTSPPNCLVQGLRILQTPAFLDEVQLPCGRIVGNAEVRAEQRVVQEGSSPSGARMRGAISKSGGNSSLAEGSRRYADV